MHMVLLSPFRKLVGVQAVNLVSHDDYDSLISINTLTRESFPEKYEEKYFGLISLRFSYFWMNAGQKCNICFSEDYIIDLTERSWTENCISIISLRFSKVRVRL